MKTHNLDSPPWLRREGLQGSLRICLHLFVPAADAKSGPALLPLLHQLVLPLRTSCEMAKSKKQKATRSTGGPAEPKSLEPPPSTRVLRSATRSRDPPPDPHLAPKARVLPPPPSARSRDPSEDPPKDVDVEMSEPTTEEMLIDKETPGDDVSGCIPIVELSLT
jgi:hypothetical protein